MRFSIRWKILILFTATLLIVAAVNLILISRVLKSDYKAALDSELMAFGENLKSQLIRITELGIAVDDIENFDQLCRDLAGKKKSILDAMVIDAQGGILFHNNPAMHGRQLDHAQILTAIKKDAAGVYSVLEDRDHMYYAVTPFQKYVDRPEYAVVISAPARIIDTKVRRLIWECNLIFVFAFGITALLLLAGLNAMLTSPLSKILTTIQKIIRHRDLEEWVDVQSRDEIGQIADSFNRMIRDLRQTTTSIENLNLEIETRRQAELQAQFAKREAEHANHAKSTFLANMSHEIRTPMNSIVGFSELLSEENLAEDQKKFVKMILENARSLLVLINDILDFSKIEAGKLDIEIIECSLRDLLSGIESVVSFSVKRKGIKFKIILDETLPKRIYTDPVRLKQCLVNLINNAVKFTEKGYVHVHIYRMPDSRDSGSMTLCMDVEDTGIGIPLDKLETIFEAFSQADSSNTRKYGGTGLGLSITRKLIEALGGKLTVTSEAGKGSTFRIQLPVAAPDECLTNSGTIV